MIKKIQLLTILCLFLSVSLPTHTHAQVKSKDKKVEKFSQEEITAFCKTQLLIKKYPFDVESSFKKAVANSDLPEKRFSEIFNAQFAGTDAKITSKEQLSLDNFKISVEKDKAEYDKKTKDFVAKQEISWNLYEKMLKEYRSDTNFQRVVATKMQETINQK